ncbi:hypothetical protein Ferp_0506 [Ferroglobus placidus DSM 10642]|uniref:Uncharacterized protein n=1 Tax=Ferroglobus placidus (strain DSM 10642 / AEDII12DO) TaxID=589924 RepID=D3S347_FERPA|nr:hypothetical protein [Ferroglobus placidus]ADC64680.1 hypothetical protein Ferp_0506 [Ferroglobus placidus DSM 10642]
MEYMFVNLKLDRDVWDTFRGAVKFRKGDLSREFTRALSLYLGALDNTLALRRYYSGILQVSELINPVFEMFDYGMPDGCEIVPLKVGFSDELLKKIAEICMERGEILACIDDLRAKVVDPPETVDEVVERVRDKYSIEFRVNIEEGEGVVYVLMSESRIKFNSYPVSEDYRQRPR